ncbi:MAG: hypothetical protein JW995_08380 [Melioribacteraceae bacterium]|nr:hypothetical protein [Melioribacteraceae bacterium]
MCRLLAVKSKTEFDPLPIIKSFASMSKESKEYQGHGWGYSLLSDGKWKIYKSIKPVWEDETKDINTSKLLLVHARSAFRDEGIKVENNMPFCDDKYQFIFNGELRGVRIKEEGRIGAEKIFNYIKRFDKGDIVSAVKKSVGIIMKKTGYIRAMNFIISNGKELIINSLFNEDPDYFSLQISKSDEMIIVASQPLSIANNWTTIENNSIKVI